MGIAYWAIKHILLLPFFSDGVALTNLSKRSAVWAFCILLLSDCSDLDGPLTASGPCCRCSVIRTALLLPVLSMIILWISSASPWIPNLFPSFCPWLKQGFHGIGLSRLSALRFLIQNVRILPSESSMLKVITQILLRSQAWKNAGPQSIGSFQCPIKNYVIFARDSRAVLFRYPLQGSAITARPFTLDAGVLPL